MLRLPRRRARTIALASALLAVLVPATAQAALPQVKVMTRNLYFGADTARIVAAAGSSDPTAVPTAAGVTFGIVLRNNWPARAQAIADEIQTQRPDLVGLQEVAQFFTGPFNDPATATTPFPGLDFMQVLQSALASRGLHYAVVSSPNVETDQEVPAFLSSDPSTWRDIRLVTSNAILANTDRAGLTTSNPRTGEFATQLSVLGQPLHRNWLTVDGTVGGKRFRFLDTHLEARAQDEAIRNAQAKELAAGPLQATAPMIVVGDFNSNPGTATGGAYSILTAANQGKLRDAGSAGFTCCRGEVLTDPGVFNQRIDLTLAVPQVKPLSTTLTGLAAVVPGGLFPSDHAGVVTTYTVP